MRPEPQTRPLSLYIVAAEESGDALGAALVRALKARHGGALTFNGVGGRAMAAAGISQSISPSTSFRSWALRRSRAGCR